MCKAYILSAEEQADEAGLMSDIPDENGDNNNNNIENILLLSGEKEKEEIINENEKKGKVLLLSERAKYIAEQTAVALHILDETVNNININNINNNNNNNI
eukprot:Tbor_TRINITY_DN5369_c3_g3::TRINITY_DN5369_c3_g3_i1::g.3954::m.3954